jgi:hypothetical protein
MRNKIVTEIDVSLYISLKTFLQNKTKLLDVRHEGIWGSGGIAPLILNVGNGWRLASRLVCFGPRKKPLYTLNKVGSTAGLDVLCEESPLHFSRVEPPFFSL